MTRLRLKDLPKSANLALLNGLQGLGGCSPNKVTDFERLQ